MPERSHLHLVSHRRQVGQADRLQVGQVVRDQVVVVVVVVVVLVGHRRRWIRRTVLSCVCPSGVQ